MAGYIHSLRSSVRDGVSRVLGALMSLNDPQWGKKPGGGNQGPPDLDEIWRNFNKKLGGLFGKRGGGGGNESGGGGGGGPSNAQIGGGAGVLAGVVLVVWLATGFYTVNEGQQGVVLRFGKFSETTGPGLRWRIPYPVESKEIVNVAKVNSVEVGYRNSVKSKVPKESLMLTDDENIVDVQFAVQYVLKNPRDYLFNSRSPDDSVLQAAETAIREIVGKSTMDFVLQQGRADVAARAKALMQVILDRYGTGISISNVTMQDAQPPDKVQHAFDDAVKAGQDRERQKNEGQAYANDILPKAKGTATRLLQEAEGYRQRVVQEAEGDASRFTQVLTEYAKAPQVTRERLYLDAMQQIFANTTKVVVDQKGGNSLLYLPLDKILQMPGAASVDVPAKPPEPAAAAPAPSATPEAARSRDAFRTREREQRP